MTSGSVIAIVGATGTGKSDLALDLAEHFGGEIINTDAMQFYRGMDIGTAKLTVPERRGIEHHLLDILDVAEEASVADFQHRCRERIDDCFARGKAPILVGGSGLYVRAAVDVLEFPPTDPGVRTRLEREHEQCGLAPLKGRLGDVDPVSAARLDDARRIIRALEVIELTGRTFSSFMPQREYVRPTVQIGLTMPRPELHERLAHRVELMMERGLVEEARGLLEHGLRDSRTASHAIGYRQALAVIDGDMTTEQAVDSTVVATRQFARRQETWFGADPRVSWLDALEPGIAEQAIGIVTGEKTGRRTMRP